MHIPIKLIKALCRNIFLKNSDFGYRIFSNNNSKCKDIYLFFNSKYANKFLIKLFYNQSAGGENRNESYSLFLDKRMREIPCPAPAMKAYNAPYRAYTMACYAVKLIVKGPRGLRAPL